MRAAWLVLGFGLVAGCSDDTTEVTPLPERDQFAQSLAAILCEGATTTSCCSELDLAAPGDGCKKSMRDQVFIALITQEEEHRTVALDDKDTCFEAYRAALESNESCAALPHPRELISRCPTLFSQVPDGPGAPGDPCSHLYDCSSPEAGVRECQIPVFESVGVCLWRVPVDSGADCSAPPGVVSQCPAGQGCVENAAGDGVECATASDTGDACVANNSCVEGLYCHGTTADDQTCEAPRKLGDLCDDWVDGCEPGTFCNEVFKCDKLPIVAACEQGGCPSPIDSYCKK